MVTACKAWHPYIFGRPVVLRTDNSAVVWAKRIKNPVNQMARWLQTLDTYDLQEVHRPGRVHWNVDGLSRRPHSPCPQCHREEGICTEKGIEKERVDSVSCAVLTRAQLRDDQCTVSQDFPTTAEPDLTESWSNDEIRNEQLEDPNITFLFTSKEVNAVRPEWREVASESGETKALWGQYDRLLVCDGALYRRWEDDRRNEVRYQLVVPQTRRRLIMSQAHDSPLGGHLGSDKTVSKIKDNYYWVNFKADVREYCRQCEECAARKPKLKHKKAPMRPYVIGSPMERITTDIMGPLDRTTSGNKYVLVVTDTFTKWTEAYALPNIESKTVARKIAEEWVCRYGTPVFLHSDQGRQFESRVFQEMCRILGIKKTRSTPLRPQSNGQVERFNRTLGAQLSIYSGEQPKLWDRHQPFVLGAYRAAQHDTTGMTPNYLMFGREVRLPLPVVTGNPNERSGTNAEDYATEMKLRFERAFEITRRCLKKAAELRKKRYDVGSTENRLSVGQSVWLFDPQKSERQFTKLRSAWKKGWVVTHKIDDVIFRIQSGPNDSPRVVHSDRLLPYEGRNPPTWFKPNSI